MEANTQLQTSQKYELVDLRSDERFYFTKALPDGYKVSNYGRVLSMERTVIRSNGRTKLIASKILTQQVSSNGYACVTLRSKENKKKTLRVHRLVAYAFIPNAQPENSIINHKDGNKLNNHFSNLEWCDYSDNLNHAYRAGLRVANTLPANLKRKTQNSYGRQ